MEHTQSPSTAETLVGVPVVSKHTDTPLTDSSTPRIIPPTHPFRTLVVCFDGTGDVRLPPVLNRADIDSRTYSNSTWMQVSPCDA